MVRSAEIAATLVDSLDIPVCAVKKSGGFLYWNRAFSECASANDDALKQMDSFQVLGGSADWDVARFSGTKWLDTAVRFVNPLGVPQAYRASVLSHDFDSESAWLVKLQLPTSDEAARAVQQAHMRGRVDELETVLNARTKELEFARDRAMAANRAKSGFLANMSHELRTPLNAVIGYSEILIEDLGDAGQAGAVSDLKKIQSAGKHLLALINDILDLSKIEAGKMGLNLEYFRVDTMLRDVVETILPMAAKNGTAFEMKRVGELGVMLCDITKIRQILFNLISNGIKFAEQGHVELQIERVMENEREHYTFVVRDDGIGMTLEQQEKLFQEFFQGDQSASRKWGGTGLGLVISQRFAQMMGGEIVVESALGKGSVFRVKMPTNTAKLRFHSSANDAQVGPRVDPKLIRFAVNDKYVARRHTISRVLVIDDDPHVRDLMERYLTREGFEVMSAENGQDGIKRIKSFAPHVITLDVLMPVMDGWSVLSELKRDPDTANIPVIMLSMLDELDMSFALGAADYLVKPVKRDLLLETVFKHLREKNNGRVLVVDDQFENRDVVARILKGHGLTVAEAGNGVEALTQLALEKPHLILLDLMMPEMDGFRFSEEVKKHPEWAGIPIIVITAMELTPDDIKRLNGNVDKIYERKEIDFKNLLSQIHELIAARVRGKSGTSRQ